MEPHPEGGYFRETYRSSETVAGTALPGRFGGERNFSTAIYFLLEAGNFSALHRIKSDEAWHFYAGDALDVIEIDEQGNLRVTSLGSDPEAGEIFQHIVPAGRWFGSRVKAGGSFSLVGCTVSPGFDFTDFEMAERKKLMEQFPQHALLIEDLTRI
ncbi:MAG: hypothetical protein FD123_884 [Bacteroidetes bacterium]|nr:MAG: hypothetical protein FD123_884 [Bacteroidota bacterium]